MAVVESDSKFLEPILKSLVTPAESFISFTGEITKNDIGLKTDEGTAFVKVSQNSVQVASNDKTGINVGENKITLQGNVTFNTTPDGFRILGGLFKLNHETLYIPSTVVYPVMTFLPNTDVVGMLKNMLVQLKGVAI